MARAKCGSNRNSGYKQIVVLATTQRKSVYLAQTRFPLLDAAAQQDLSVWIAGTQCPVTCPDRKVQTWLTQRIRLGSAPPIEAGGSPLFQATPRTTWTAVITCKARPPPN